MFNSWTELVCSRLQSILWSLPKANYTSIGRFHLKINQPSCGKPVQNSMDNTRKLTNCDIPLPCETNSKKQKGSFYPDEIAKILLGDGGPATFSAFYLSHAWFSRSWTELIHKPLLLKRGRMEPETYQRQQQPHWSKSTSFQLKWSSWDPGKNIPELK